MQLGAGFVTLQRLLLLSLLILTWLFIIAAGISIVERLQGG